jgi:hypothetical protein
MIIMIGNRRRNTNAICCTSLHALEPRRGISLAVAYCVLVFAISISFLHHILRYLHSALDAFPKY